MSLTRDDLLALLETNARERKGVDDADEWLISEFGLTVVELRGAITADIMDTFDNVLAQMRGTREGNTLRISTVDFAGVLAAHMHLWFILGLRVAKDHG
jgi:hypothetical protein